MSNYKSVKLTIMKQSYTKKNKKAPLYNISGESNTSPRSSLDQCDSFIMDYGVHSILLFETRFSLQKILSV